MNPMSKFTPRARQEKTIPVYKCKDSVDVFCRLYPLKNGAESTCIKVISPDTLRLSTPVESKCIRKEVHYKFKQILTAYANQNEVFEKVAYPLLEDLLNGKNGLLFTYGVTGSGKTYTLTGNQQNPGIIPKSIYTIFNSIGEHQAPQFVIKSDRMNRFEVQCPEDAMYDQLNEIKTMKTPFKTPSRSKKIKDLTFVNDGNNISVISTENLYSVFVSYIEIYNNTIFDLLDENTGKTVHGKILREDSQKNMYVNGVIETEVKSAEEAFQLFNVGQKRRKMANTLLNAVSSRSHSIFTIRIVQLRQISHSEEGLARIPNTNFLKISQLCLVDLAGSERTNRTQNTGQLLKEASKINNSLFCLRKCLENLRENQLADTNKLVPYRDSRLTHLFKNYFEGEGKISMIICVNPSVDDFDENLQVMKFAEMTQDVKILRSEPKYTPCKKTILKKPATPFPRKNIITSHENFIVPKLPDIHLRNTGNFDQRRIVLEEMKNCIKTRTKLFKEVDCIFEEKNISFRKRLDLESSCSGRSEILSLKAQSRKQDYKGFVAESKLSDTEVRNLELNELVIKQGNKIAFCRNVIATKDTQINKNFLEKDRNKRKLAAYEEKLNQALEVKLKRQKQLQDQLQANETEIQKATEMLAHSLPQLKMATLALPEIPKQEIRRHIQTPKGSRRRSRSVEILLEHTIQPLTKENVTHHSNYCLVEQVQSSDEDVMET